MICTQVRLEVLLLLLRQRLQGDSAASGGDTVLLFGREMYWHVQTILSQLSKVANDYIKVYIIQH